MKSAEFETTWRPVETEEDKEEIKAVVNQTGKYDPNRFPEERLIGSRVSEILSKGINALPKDNPVLNTTGRVLGYIADNYTHKGVIKAEESIIDYVGEIAPSIGFDKTFLQLSAGFLIPGGGEMKTVKRTIKSAHLLSDAAKSKRLYDPIVTAVSRDKGGAFGTGHRGLANISYADNIGLKRKFTNLHQLQTQSPFKHHHIEDIAFTGKWMNTSDYQEVVKELNKIKIYPGDSPTNIIGMMDEGNLFLQTGKTDLIRNLKKTNFPGLEGINKYSDLTKKNAPKEIRRIIDDVFKSPEYGDDFFKGSIDKLGRKTDNQIGDMFETLPDGTRVSTVLPKDPIGYPTWKALGLETNTKEFLSLPKKQQNLLKQQAWAKRWETLGVNRKDIKYDPTKMILSKDHIDTIHYNVYNSPKFKEKVELIKMIDDGSYYKLTAAQKAEKIAEVYKIQKNTSINVAKKRLKLIKNFLKKSEPIRYRDIYSKDPTKLRQWIIDNPSISANLGWKDELLDYKTLTKDPGKVTSEFKTVFSTLVQ